MFQQEGHDEFLGLAGHSPVLGKEDILDDLLADGAAAFDGLTGFDVDQDGPDNADRVDGTVVVEAAVFRGDDGMLHGLGNGVDGYVDGDFLDLVVHSFVEVQVWIDPDFQRPQRCRPASLRFLFFLELGRRLDGRLGRFRRVEEQVPAGTDGKGQGKDGDVF